MSKLMVLSRFLEIVKWHLIWVLIRGQIEVQQHEAIFEEDFTSQGIYCQLPINIWLELSISLILRRTGNTRMQYKNYLIHIPIFSEIYKYNILDLHNEKRNVKSWMVWLKKNIGGCISYHFNHVLLFVAQTILHLMEILFLKVFSLDWNIQ